MPCGFRLVQVAQGFMGTADPIADFGFTAILAFGGEVLRKLAGQLVIGQGLARNASRSNNWRPRSRWASIQESATVNVPPSQTAKRRPVMSWIASSYLPTKSFKAISRETASSRRATMSGVFSSTASRFSTGVPAAAYSSSSSAK